MAVLLALLVSQAASSVCAVQCVEHPAMPHCHAMSHGGGALLKNCSTGICTVDLLVNRQQETVSPTGIHIDVRSGVFPLPTLPATSFTRAPRSSVSPPPLVTALRI